MNTFRPHRFLAFALATVVLLGGCRRPTSEDAVQPDARPVAVVHRAQAAQPARAEAVATISAGDLAQAFANDPSATASRFGHRAVEVSGEVGNVEADGSGVPVLTLRGGRHLGDPRLVLDADAWSDVSTLRAGAKVSLLCREAAPDADRVTLHSCTLVRVQGKAGHASARNA